MQNFPDVRTSEIGEITPGKCFALDWRGNTYIGIAIAPHRLGEPPDFIAVSPGHPDLGGMPGILSSSVIHNRPVLVIPDAKVVLPMAREHIHLGYDGFGAPAGALISVNGDLGLAAVVQQHETRIYNLHDGSEIRADLSRHAWFSSWEIATPDINGEWKSICSVTCGGQVA